MRPPRPRASAKLATSGSRPAAPAAASGASGAHRDQRRRRRARPPTRPTSRWARLGLRPELQHVAENQPRPAAGPAPRRERVERRANGDGVGVVGVVEDPDAAGLAPDQPPLDGHRRARAAAASSSGTPSASPTAAAAAAFQALCRPASGSRTSAVAGPAASRNPSPPSIRATSPSRTSARSRLAVRDDRARGPGAASAQHQGVVGVQHDDAVGRNRLDELALGLLHPLDRADTLEVGRRDRRHHPDRRAGRAGRARRSRRRRSCRARAPPPRAPARARGASGARPTGCCSSPGA